jgi:hypothetical protein
MQEQSVLDLMEKYEKMDMKKMKYNLQMACASRYKEFDGREGMAKKLDMNLNSFATCINPSQESKLTFKNLVDFCVTFNIDIETILNSNTEITKSAKGQKKIWDYKKMKEYVKLYEKSGIEKVMEKYKLTQKTAMLYYSRFKGENGENEK